MTDPANTTEPARASLRRRIATLFGLWPAALIGVAALATIAWGVTLAWFVVRGVLRLLSLA